MNFFMLVYVSSGKNTVCTYGGGTGFITPTDTHQRCTLQALLLWRRGKSTHARKQWAPWTSDVVCPLNCVSSRPIPMLKPQRPIGLSLGDRALKEVTKAKRSPRVDTWSVRIHALVGGEVRELAVPAVGSCWQASLYQGPSLLFSLWMERIHVCCVSCPSSVVFVTVAWVD